MTNVCDKESEISVNDCNENRTEGSIDKRGMRGKEKLSKCEL